MSKSSKDRYEEGPSNIEISKASLAGQFGSNLIPGQKIAGTPIGGNSIQVDLHATAKAFGWCQDPLFSKVGSTNVHRFSGFHSTRDMGHPAQVHNSFPRSSVVPSSHSCAVSRWEGQGFSVEQCESIQLQT